VSGAAGVVAIGRHMADYIARWSGRESVVIHPPIYGAGPFPDYGRNPGGLVTMINPCAVKGLSIFLETAAHLPEVEFGVVPGWGTTSADRRALERMPNVSFLPNPREIDEVLARTRVLLMPSLWYEGFGLVAMESMLRGIPVVASDSGGLVEAKHGTGYTIPVKTIERYEPVFDEHAMPRPVVPANDAGPWVAALRELFGDPAAYEAESRTSRARALRFAAGLDAAGLERLLLSLHAGPDARLARATIESLSPERRALLLERLRKRKGAG